MDLELLLSNKLLDSTLIIAAFSAIFYYFGTLADPNPTFNRYTMGFLCLVAYIFLPTVVFFTFFYNITFNDVANSYRIILILQFLISLILVSIAFSNQAYSKLRNWINSQSTNWLIGYIISIFISWIMIYFSLNLGINKTFNTVSTFKPEPNNIIANAVLFFYIWLPMYFSLIIISLCIIFLFKRGDQQSSQP